MLKIVDVDVKILVAGPQIVQFPGGNDTTGLLGSIMSYLSDFFASMEDHVLTAGYFLLECTLSLDDHLLLSYR